MENAKKGIVAGLLNKIVSIIMPFFVKTILIRSLGIQYVGLQGVFSSILSVLSVAELGFGSAIIYSMYEPIAHDDIPGICALLSFYRRVYRFVGLFILVLGLTIIPFLSYIVPDKNIDINIYVVYLLYLANATASYFLFSYRLSILNAFQRTDIISIINTFAVVGTSSFQIVLIVFTRNYYLALLVAIIFTLINNISVAVITEKMYPNLECKGRIDDSLRVDISKRVKGLLIAKICGITRNSFDNMFVSAFLGLAIAGIYSNYYYVMNSIIAILSIISPALLGGVGNSIQLESVDKNYNDMTKLNYIYMQISGWFAICLLCLYQPFMKLWVGDSNIFSNEIMILFVIYFYVKQMGNVRGIYSDAAGLFWENRYRALAEAAVNLVLNYLFIRRYGVKGIVGATIISLFFIGFLGSAEVIFRCYFKNGLIEYLLDNARYMIVTTIFAIVFYYICTKLDVVGFKGLIIRAIICLTIPPILFVLVGVTNKKDKNALRWFYEEVLRG